MTWGDIQLASVRKMFLNTTIITLEDIPKMRTDKKFLTYLDAMPDAANEGLLIMATRGKPIINQQILTMEKVNEEYAIDGYYCFLLSELLERYLEIDGVYVSGGEYRQYAVRDNKFLYVPQNVFDNNTVTVTYRTYPKRITAETLDNETIEAPMDMLNILPLYIASELYKDDDISLATYYRNEFETELENMRRGRTDIHFTSVKGWL